jgi:hypothetical protein
MRIGHATAVFGMYEMPSADSTVGDNAKEYGEGKRKY